jgi:hypothetical protein
MVSQRELEGLRHASMNEVLKRSDRRKKKTIAAQNTATTPTPQRAAGQHASRRSSQRNKKDAATEESEEEAAPVKDPQDDTPSSPQPPAAPTLTFSQVHTIFDIVPHVPNIRATFSMPQPSAAPILALPKVYTMEIVPDYRECEVCGDVFHTEDFPHLGGCPSLPAVCRDCFANWLDSRVGATVKLDDIKCPCASEQCKATFDYDTVQQYATPDVFARYDRLKLQEFLRNDPSFRHCIAPDCP